MRFNKVGRLRTLNKKWKKAEREREREICFWSMNNNNQQPKGKNQNKSMPGGTRPVLNYEREWETEKQRERETHTTTHIYMRAANRPQDTNQITEDKPKTRSWVTPRHRACIIKFSSSFYFYSSSPLLLSDKNRRSDILEGTWRGSAFSFLVFSSRFLFPLCRVVQWRFLFILIGYLFWFAPSLQGCLDFISC